ncbi:MAG: hypothetical protein ACI85U_001862 [Candidatus Promineifilaceae bacterium]|jgi:hypothetical protein
MFEIGGTYENRNGKYEVIEIEADLMTVKYKDGSEFQLRMGIQERIWLNIVAEQEAANSRSRKKKTTTSKANHYIKSIKSISEGLLNPADITTAVTPTSPQKAPVITSGDRFIYYSILEKGFFAVATITGDPKKAKASDYADLNFDEKRIHIYPIDIDAHAGNYEKMIYAEGFELESQPDYREKLTEGEMYLLVSEDDFELLAEALTEFLEVDDEDELDSDDSQSDDDDSLIMDDEDIVV